MHKLLNVLFFVCAFSAIVAPGCQRPPRAHVPQPYGANSSAPLSTAPNQEYNYGAGSRGYRPGSGTRSAPAHQGSGSR